MYTVYTDTFILTATALNKSVNYACTLKVTDFCMIYLYSTTILDNVELYKDII